MFTGLIEATGRVVDAARRESGARLVIDPRGWEHEPPAGASIAVSGCCLTHAPGDGDAGGLLVFDVVAETLRKTKLGRLEAGARVNLEAPLTPSSPLGGHFVQGHVDGVGRVRSVEAGGEHRVTIEAGRELAAWIVPGGSIAVDGVSLTVASADAGAGVFSVALIPTTLRETTLGELRAGDAVNLEADMLVKAVVRYLERVRPGG